MDGKTARDASPPVSVAVINYNGRGVLEDTLRSILESAYPSFEVIVVDDCSTDDSVEFVRRNFPQVKVFTQPENKGPNAARNRALAEAENDIVLLSDNDMSLERGCLRLLVEALLADPAAGIATPLVLDSKERDRVYSDSVRLHYLAYGIIPLRHKRLPDDFDWSARRMVVGSGGMMLVRKSTVAPLGGYDEDYYFGYDDGEFTLRATASGMGVYYVPRAKIYHVESAGRPKNKLRHSIGNRWSLILTVYSGRTLFLLAPAFLVFELTQAAYLTLKGAPGEWLIGLSRAARNLPATMEKRRRLQAGKKTPDGELLTSGEIFMFPYRLGGPLAAAKAVFEAFFNGYWRIVRPFLARRHGAAGDTLAHWRPAPGVTRRRRR